MKTKTTIGAAGFALSLSFSVALSVGAAEQRESSDPLTAGDLAGSPGALAATVSEPVTTEESAPPPRNPVRKLPPASEPASAVSNSTQNTIASNVEPKGVLSGLEKLGLPSFSQPIRTYYSPNARIRAEKVAASIAAMNKYYTEELGVS